MANSKRGSFKCVKCGRTFPMAMHLGRHMATIHGRRPARAKRRVGPAAKAPVRVRLQTDPLGGVLGDVSSWQDRLMAQRANLDSQIEALGQLMASLGTPAPKSTIRVPVRRGKHLRRAAPPGSLRAHIEQVLLTQRGPMPVRAITAAVLKAGYKSHNKELSKSIGKLMRAMPGVARVGRGVFRLK